MADPAGLQCAGRRPRFGPIVHGLALAGLAGLTAGCPPPPAIQPLEPLPLDQAVEIVHRNSRRMTAGLKATGPVRGALLVADGEIRGFDLRGKLLLIPPRHLRFEADNALGRPEFLLGSNQEHFWLHIDRDDDTFRFGRYATPDEDRAMALPIRPDLMLEAIGVVLPSTELFSETGPVQVIDHDHQKLLFLSRDPQGKPVVSKEYRLSRHSPRLVVGVVFRDAIGAALMQSDLSDYRPVDGSGPLLPHRLRIDWPACRSWIEFDVDRWQQRDELTTDHGAFRLPGPETLRARYRRVVDIDSGESASSDG